MGSFSIKKGKKSLQGLQGPRVTQGAFGSIKWEGKEWLTEGILIAMSSRASRTLEATSRLSTDCIDQRSLSLLCKPNAEMGQCCRNIDSKVRTHHARKVHCFAQSISDVERSGMSSRTGNNCVNCQVSTGTECRHEYIITHQDSR